MIKIEELVNIFKEIKSIELIILFGSRVDNPEKQDSDIDFCFVIDNESKSNIIFEKVSEILTHSKVLIHPVIFTKNEFVRKTQIKVYRESIIEKGKVMYKRNNKA